LIRLPDYKSVIKDNQKICVLNEAHNYLDGAELLERLGDGVFVDLKKTCLKCEEKVKFERYAVGVNTNQINFSYELYRDTYIETGLKNLIYYSNIADREIIEKLKKLLEDLRVFNSEKDYDIKSKTEDEKIMYLKKQNYYIENLTEDNKSVLKYIIHLPIGRIGTTPEEDKIIHSLSTKSSTNIYKKYFTIYKEQDLN
jgi:hypothetical protein